MLLFLPRSSLARQAAPPSCAVRGSSAQGHARPPLSSSPQPVRRHLCSWVGTPLPAPRPPSFVVARLTPRYYTRAVERFIRHSLLRVPREEDTCPCPCSTAIASRVVHRIGRNMFGEPGQLCGVRRGQ